MTRFRKILALVGYVGGAGATVMAATGVGTPIAAVLVGVSVLSSGILHFLDSPTKSSQELLELGKQAKAVRDAVEAAKKR